MLLRSFLYCAENPGTSSLAISISVLLFFHNFLFCLDYYFNHLFDPITFATDL